VLFLLFGSAAADKTTAMNTLSERFPDLAIHDFDEIGVPPDANTGWRHRATEKWLRRALDYQAEGTDLLLAGQIPYGELLATPSAPQLDAISACLLDCDDQARIARIRARGPEWLGWTVGDLEGYLNWAEWMRHHATDPSWRTDVIRHPDTEEEMRWERWADWEAGDPRWRVRVIDSSALAVPQVATELATWIREERARAAPLAMP
jgi:hypothetical protein